MQTNIGAWLNEYGALALTTSVKAVRFVRALTAIHGPAFFMQTSGRRCAGKLGPFPGHAKNRRTPPCCAFHSQNHPMRVWKWQMATEALSVSSPVRWIKPKLPPTPTLIAILQRQRGRGPAPWRETRLSQRSNIRHRAYGYVLVWLIGCDYHGDEPDFALWSSQEARGGWVISRSSTNRYLRSAFAETGPWLAQIEKL